MKKLTQDQSKIDLVGRLVKDGVIDFVDAIKLLEVEVEKEYITVPYFDYGWKPQIPIWQQSPFTVECKTPLGVSTSTNLMVYPN